MGYRTTFIDHFVVQKCLFVTLMLLVHGATLYAKTVTYIWDYKELMTIRSQPASREYLTIIRKAENIVRQQPVAVTDKTVCQSGNKHKYESLSIYWWPDPNTPGGPYIARDGQYNPEYKQYDYPRLLKLKENLAVCSKAYFLTNDNRYYDFFCRQLDTWFIADSTYMTPDFDYCQIIPGRNGNKGNPQGMADIYNFNDVMESIRLVNSVKCIGHKRMKALKAWFLDFAQWMQTSENGKKAYKFKNGQVLTFDTTIYDIFVFTGRKSKRKKIFREFPAKRVMAQIEDDGKMPEALKRTRALSYSVINLQRFVDFATLAKSDGNRLPEESLLRIRSAFDYITPFIYNQQSFPYSELGDWGAQVKLFELLKKRFDELQ